MALTQDKRFSAHKAILAARSPVFKTEFTKEKSKKDNPHQVRIHDVDASTFEQFLHFVYTGETMTPLLANANLLKLAERYQLKTLGNLCRVALLEVDVEQMVSMVANPRSSDGQETSCKIRLEIFLNFFRLYVNFSFHFSPDKEAEAYADNSTNTFELCWTFKDEDEARSMKVLATYLKERTIFAKIFGEKLNNDDNDSHFEKPLIQFFILKPLNCEF